MELTSEDKAFLIQTALDHPDFTVNIPAKDLRVGDIFSNHDFMEVLEISESDKLNLSIKVKFNKFGAIGTVEIDKEFRVPLYIFKCSF